MLATTHYLCAIDAEVKEAEFILAIVYPTGFKRRFEFLSKSATWTEEALPLIFNSIHLSTSVNTDKTYFWALIMRASYPQQHGELIEMIPEYETTLIETKRIKVTELAAQWQITFDEKNKRKIIDSLYL